VASNKTTVSARIDRRIVEAMDSFLEGRRPFIQDRTQILEIAVVEFLERYGHAPKVALGAHMAATKAASEAARAAYEATLDLPESRSCKTIVRRRNRKSSGASV
jgi:hypothetical protein